MNKIIYIAILCAFIVTISFYDFQMNELPQPEHALYYPEAKEIKGFHLTDHQGQSFSKEQLIDKWSFVFLGYTSCPHICSPTLQNLHFIYNDLKRVAANTEVLLISVDPKRDSQAVLSQFISFQLLPAHLTGTSTASRQPVLGESFVRRAASLGGWCAGGG